MRGCSRGKDTIPTAYPPKELDAWAGRLQAVGARRESRTICRASTAARRRSKAAPRDVFAYVIHEGKMRAPAAAMALIERLTKSSSECRHLDIAVIARLINHAVRFAQPLHQNAHDVEREIRRVADHHQKLLLGDRNERHVGCRHRGGAARAVIDQRHLAENAELRQGVEQAVAEADLDVAALDDEQFLAGSPSRKMTSPALKVRTGAPAPAKMPKSTGLSAHIAVPCLIARLLQSHVGGRLQFYDSRCAD